MSLLDQIRDLKYGSRELLDAVEYFIDHETDPVLLAHLDHLLSQKEDAKLEPLKRRAGPPNSAIETTRW